MVSNPNHDGENDIEKHIKRPEIEIEYCSGCKWLLRSAWMAQEILTTFESSVGKVSLVPSLQGSGIFIIRFQNEIIWDRKSEKTAGFPELKKLKQIIRDKIDPSISLGHSDSKVI